MLLDLTTVKFLGDYGTKPIYLFGLLGRRSSSAAASCRASSVIEKFNGGVYAHRNPLLLLAVMLFVVGIQLIGMGLLAELLVRTYHESQQKPVYLVAEEVNAPVEAPPAPRARSCRCPRCGARIGAAGAARAGALRARPAGAAGAAGGRSGRAA